MNLAPRESETTAGRIERMEKYFSQVQKWQIVTEVSVLLQDENPCDTIRLGEEPVIVAERDDEYDHFPIEMEGLFLYYAPAKQHAPLEYVTEYPWGSAGRA